MVTKDLDLTQATKFIIDTETKKCSTADGESVTLAQKDHKSKAFTFECDEYADGYSLKDCNTVRIHYSSVDSKTKQENKGVYETSQINFNQTTGKINFDWIITRNCTIYSGVLSFVVEFLTISNGVVDYSWHTDFNRQIKVITSMDNSEETVEEIYPDVITQMEEQLQEYIDKQLGVIENGSY